MAYKLYGMKNQIRARKNTDARENSGRKPKTIRFVFYQVENSEAGLRASLERIRFPYLYECGRFRSDIFKGCGGPRDGYISTDRGADDADQIKEERKMKNNQLSKRAEQLKESFSEKVLEKDGE